MKRLALAHILLISAVALLGLLDLNPAVSTTEAPVVPFHASTIHGEPTLQEWFTQNGYAINVTANELDIETFEAGYYKITVLTEIADYAPLNNLSWYPIGNAHLNHVFSGDNMTGDTAYFMADETFGLCLGSPEGYFYTEPCRNEDGEDHALILMNPNASGYIIAWEDLWQLGDADYQDLVLAALTPIEVCVRYCPRTLNLKSKGRWITAIIKLPRGYNTTDVDVSSIMLNGTVPADQEHYAAYECEDLCLLIVKFSRKAVIELIKNSLEERDYKEWFIRVWLTLTGRFSDGLPFQGTNKIRVIHFECRGYGAKEWRCGFSCRPFDIHAILPRLLRVYHANRLS